MSSPSPTTPPPTQNKRVKSEPTDDDDLISSADISPAKKTKTTPKAKAKAKSGSTPTKANSNGSGDKGGWSPAKRIKLFETFVKHSAVKWNEVAAEMGEGATAQSCREQWQRGMRTKFLKALSEDSSGIRFPSR